MKANQGVASNLSYFWKSALKAMRTNLELSPILSATTRQRVEGHYVWHNPFVNLPHELAQYKALWEHLQNNTLDNLADPNGTIFTPTTLENFLTKKNGVIWHRDHATVTVHFDKISKRVVIVEPWLKSWEAIISNIPDWCMQLIRQPRFCPDQIAFPQPRGPRSHPAPTHVLVTPRNEWFILYPRHCYRASQDWRGRVHVTPPKDAEIAAQWGSGYVHAKRVSFPVAAEFSFKGDTTPLDKLIIKKLTYLISRRNSTPPTRHVHKKMARDSG
jgi:hypothetical protein